MVVIRVLGWNTDRGWVDWSDYHRQYLEDQLAILTDLDKQSAKRFARAIRDKESIEACLSNSIDTFRAERFRSFLESLGAVVIVQGAEPNAISEGEA